LLVWVALVEQAQVVMGWQVLRVLRAVLLCLWL
jgi:hypothetical protein